ncbi:MAG: LLM class flavin-dependent oxidoreductase, partial [Nitratireductor sp.]
HLSRGRLEIGIGIGAYREEFEALHPGWKVHRGRMVEEAFQALDLLYNQRSASFDGEFYKFNDIEMYPKTFQPVLPTYVGGNNVNALQRTVDYATGWLPACLAVEKLRENVQKLHALAEQKNRDPKQIEVAPQYVVYVGRTREQAIARFQESQMHKHLVSLSQSTLKDQGEVRHEDINLIGTPEQVIEKAQALKAAGATHLLGLYFAVNTLPELYDQMEIFAKEVVPHI